MIVVQQGVSSWRMIFAYKASILPIILPQLAQAASWGLAVACVNWYFSVVKVGTITEDTFPTMAPFSVLGVAISLFLSFRTNACYNRWWEARQQWGMQYNATRSLTRIVCSMLPHSAGDIAQNNRAHSCSPAGTPSANGTTPAVARTIAKLGVAHSHALRAQLRATWFASRGGPPGATVHEAEEARNGFLETQDMSRIASSNNPALVILHVAGEHVGKLLRQGELDSIGAVAINQQLDALCNTQGASERIANTLVPHSYSLLVYRTIAFYVLISPLAMVSAVGWYTPLFNLVIAYAFFGINEVARQCEQPFGDEPNALALDAICRAIEMGYADVFQEHVPQPLAPDQDCRLR